MPRHSGRKRCDSPSGAVPICARALYDRAYRRLLNAVLIGRYSTIWQVCWGPTDRCRLVACP
jgi:hypothetical protein